MKPLHCVGVDLGGTNIKAGVLDDAGGVRSKVVIRTEAAQGLPHVLERIGEAVDGAIATAGLERGAIGAVGIASPGVIDCGLGIVRETPYLPGFKNLPLAESVSAAIGMPVILENDANAAAWGEFWAGAGRGREAIVLYTLGTGIGSGVIDRGHLLRGTHNAGGELGHQIVQPGGRLCGCGQKGCLEAYASARGTAARAAEAVAAGAGSTLKAILDESGTLEAQDVAAAAGAGDGLASRVWDESCRYLAIACVNTTHYLDPDLIVLGGGMAEAGDLLIDGVRRHLEQTYWTLSSPHPPVVPATLGNDAGLIGVAGLARIAAQSRRS